MVENIVNEVLKKFGIPMPSGLRREDCSPKLQAVEVLPATDGLNLFCRHAFRQEEPPPGWADLARALAAACSGLPLSLKVVGDTLRSKNRHSWECALRELHAGERLDADDAIFNCLHISFKSLSARQKGMFMDVACTLLGRPAETALQAWGVNGKWNLERLINGSLLSLHDGLLVMHDQLRDMGLSFVNGRSRMYPFKGLYSLSEVGFSSLLPSLSPGTHYTHLKLLACIWASDCRFAAGSQTRAIHQSVCLDVEREGLKDLQFDLNPWRVILVALMSTRCNF